MDETMSTGDIIIGILAAGGIVVLIGVFILVVRNIFFSGEKDHTDV